MWYEDPIRMDNPRSAGRNSRAARACRRRPPRRSANRAAFREMLDEDAIGIVMLDTGWVGGISEAHAIGKLAETYHRPFAPHDCTGPVIYTAGTHLCLALPNAMIQEGVRAYYHGWYEDVVTTLPTIDHGYVAAPSGAGLGTRPATGSFWPARTSSIASAAKAVMTA